MKKFSIILIALALTACSAVLPDKSRELSDFIPKNEKIEQIMCSTEFEFVKENFPKECRWENLIRVVDGDTIIVNTDERIRFIGVDTPEVKDPRKPIERFGPESSEKTKSLLIDTGKICLIADSIGDEIDKYGRTLAYIFTEDGLDVNAELLHTGFAKAYLYFPLERKEEFACYHKQAKEAEVGMWE